MEIGYLEIDGSGDRIFGDRRNWISEICRSTELEIGYLDIDGIIKVGLEVWRFDRSMDRSVGRSVGRPSLSVQGLGGRPGSSGDHFRSIWRSFFPNLYIICILYE